MTCTIVPSSTLFCMNGPSHALNSAPFACPWSGMWYGSVIGDWDYIDSSHVDSFDWWLQYSTATANHNLCPREAHTYVWPLFRCRDLDINLMTLKLEGNLAILKMYLHTNKKPKWFDKGCIKCTTHSWATWQTDRQTDTMIIGNNTLHLMHSMQPKMQLLG